MTTKEAYKKKQNREKKKILMNKTLEHIIFPIIAGLILALIVYVITRPKPSPHFDVKVSSQNAELPIIIIAKNDAAKRKETLDVRWDGQIFKKAAKFSGDGDSYEWKFFLKDHLNDSLADELTKPGEHKLEVTFAGKKYSEPMEVWFSTEEPEVITIPKSCPLTIKKPIEKIKFEENSKLQIIPRSFCMTEDGFFLIPDHKTGNIKIFAKNGDSLKFVKEFGRKGASEDEFNKPAYCFYDKDEKKFVVIDVATEKRKAFIYNRDNEKIDFQLYRIVRKVDGYDVRFGMNGKKLIISGYLANNDEKKSYELYTIDLENSTKKIGYLLSSPKKYHLSSENYQIEYKRALSAIGIRAFIDIVGDNIYYVWEGKLIIIKIDLKTKKRITFGQPTKHYIEPCAPLELLKAKREKKYQEMKNLREKMSYVRDIFATQQHVFVVYEGPNTDQSSRNFKLQIYTSQGKFLGEIKIPGNPGESMWFDKDSYTLYSLSKTEKEDNQILVYKINNIAKKGGKL